MKLRQNLSTPFLALGAALALVATGCQTMTPSTPAIISPEADVVLRKMSDTLTGAASFSYTGNRDIDAALDIASKVKRDAAIKGAFQRPDKFVGTVSDSASTRKLIIDGQEVTVPRGVAQEVIRNGIG